MGEDEEPNQEYSRARSLVGRAVAALCGQASTYSCVPGIFAPYPDWMLYRFGDVPKRFDTHFFFAEMPEGQEATHDQLETVDGLWIRPEEALSRFEQGNLPIVFATIHQLQALADLGSMTRCAVALPPTAADHTASGD